MKNYRLNNLTMQQLKALIHLVDERSFSRAAKKMYLTQPSMTKHIKNLEDAIDARAVVRKNSGIVLTPEGKVVYDCARRIFKLLDEAREKMSRIKEDEAGSIFISASTIPSTYILPHILQKFNKLYPDIHCYVQMNDSDATINMIIDEQAEIGFIGKPVTNKKLEAEPVWSDRLSLIVRDDHPWNQKEVVTVEELLREPFIIRERGSATRATLEDFMLQNAGLSLADCNIVSELGSSAAVKEAILAGLGVSILSTHAVKRELENGFLVEIPFENYRIDRNFYMIYKKQQNLMYYHQVFMDFVRNSLDDFTPCE